MQLLWSTLCEISSQTPGEYVKQAALLVVTVWDLKPRLLS